MLDSFCCCFSWLLMLDFFEQAVAGGCVEWMDGLGSLLYFLVQEGLLPLHWSSVSLISAAFGGCHLGLSFSASLLLSCFYRVFFFSSIFLSLHYGQTSSQGASLYCRSGSFLRTFSGSLYFLHPSFDSPVSSTLIHQVFCTTHIR